MEIEMNLFLDFIGKCAREINRDVERLYESRGRNSPDLLDRLGSHAAMLEKHVNYFARANHLTMEEIPDNNPNPFANQEPENVRYFTLEELATYNGENGAPAYVAVNGIVYDVTNNSVWQGKSHFGLMPGQDLTNAFETCHPGAMVLSVLPVVGYLILV